MSWSISTKIEKIHLFAVIIPHRGDNLFQMREKMLLIIGPSTARFDEGTLAFFPACRYHGNSGVKKE